MLCDDWFSRSLSHSPPPPPPPPHDDAPRLLSSRCIAPRCDRMTPESQTILPSSLPPSPFCPSFHLPPPSLTLGALPLSKRSGAAREFLASAAIDASGTLSCTPSAPRPLTLKPVQAACAQGEVRRAAEFRALTEIYTSPFYSSPAFFPLARLDF